jgi:hypothetical protein
MVGEARSAARGTFAVMSLIFLLIGGIGLALMMGWLTEGDASRQFTPPWWLRRRTS